MAILHQSDAGYFVCHRSLSEEMCGRPYLRSLFDIRTPFLKDQEAMSVAQEMASGVPKRRKRKKNHEVKQLPLEESKVLDFLSELSKFFQPSPSPLDFAANNKPVRDLVTQFLSSASGSKIQDLNLEMSYFNSSECVIEKEINGETFILPPHSQFYKHDITYLDTLKTKSGCTFSLIVMDPPWTNRFVKRKRKSGSVNCYQSMDNDILATLPIADLCTEGALVAIWCTNSKTHLDYLTSTLLPLWKLTYIATWFWIKVTVSGKFVCEWNGPSGKHPFERVILARKMHSVKGLTSVPIPDRQIFVSIPCAIHSFKPPLQKLLQPFLEGNGQTLELFARSLLPETVSLGNQLPLLQHISLFEERERNV
ncbi:N(6)-adenine-specific methyltransferase METTL4-like [Daphnia carinata]|uniref:N(6)-adenine-specific methyltransferase METTL4-like n=1 Tax=Daphnia carinata TaxID=120202 RepID=UPI0028683ECF|nr:N(6)-adenine-specific methyltransferase METTL4-like [Daphnia carinata]